METSSLPATIVAGPPRKMNPLEALKKELLTPKAPEDDLESLKRRQTPLRSKITATCNAIDEMVLDPKSSRRAIKKNLERVKGYINEAETLNSQIISGIPSEKEQESQQSRHLFYTAKVDKCEEDVDNILELRRDDASSHYVSEPAPSEAARQREKDIRIAMQRSASARRRAIEAEEAASAAEKALLGLNLKPHEKFDDGKPKSRDRVDDWLDDPEGDFAPPPVSEEDEAPDEWIDRYLNGTERPVPWDGGSRQHHHSSNPGEFSGRALDWFSFIELFYALVHSSTRSTAEKLASLKRCLKGECAHLVIGAGETAYKEGLRRLKADYGDRGVMRVAHMHEIESAELSADPAKFKRGAAIIRTHLFDLSRIGERNSVDIISRITQKLHVNDRLAWNTGLIGGLERRTLNTFGDWLVARAAAYQNPFTTAAEQRNQSKKQSTPQNQPAKQTSSSSFRQGGFNFRGGHQVKANVASGTSAPVTSVKDKRVPYCFKCEKQHLLENCEEFKQLSVDERSEFCTKHRLCYQCFIPKHSSRDCHRKKTCGIDGCTYNHHILLHQTTSGKIISVQSRTTPSPTVALGVVHMDTVSNGERVTINVMIDECSTSTLFREGLIHRLALPGYSHILAMEGVGGQQSQNPSKRTKLLAITEYGEEIELIGSSVPTITSPVAVTDWKQLKTRWSHLADLPLRQSGGTIDVLLGMDYGHLLAVLESRVGQDFEPIASRTRLGWIVRGVIGLDQKPQSVRVNYAFSNPALENGTELTAALNRLNETDSFGTEFEQKGLSEESQRAFKILDGGTVKLSVGFEAPIIWRDGEPQLQPNLPMVESRNRSLLNRFRQKPTYEEEYRTTMEKNFTEGYAVRVTKAELDMVRPRYYLPHFGVYKKPGSKLRIVFDGAAKSHGRSLNDAICPGPALQNPLPSVLIKFRQHEVAWVSDIQAMFSRIRLKPDDALYHYFLWTEKDGTTTTCRMTRFVFGANCSPFVAIRTTWRAAEDGGVEMQDALAAIKSNLYVDDYLGSASKLEEAVRIASLVKKALASGDFHLQSFTSNSSEFSSAMQPGGVPQDPKLVHSIGTDEAEAVLGIIWRPQKDTLGFRVTGLDSIVYTRVGLASKVASIFDPQGTASPMIVKGRLQLRILQRRGLNWTDPVTDVDLSWWKLWFATLGQLNHLEFNRCLFPKEEMIELTELHTFCDASEEAYAAVTFVRVVYKDGEVIVNHVKGSMKLSPTKTLSIPKLELNAALLGARQLRFVQKAIDRKIDSRYLWTDSSVVRNWIRSTSSSYQTFVAHRVGEIQTLTEPEEWRFVPGKKNPADAATRSQLEAEAIPYCWLFGPDFLYKPTTDWPADLPWMVVKEELRAVKIHLVTTEAPFDWESVKILPEDIPSLVKLEGDYMELLRRCQRECYQADLDQLKKKKPLKTNSSLHSLTPIIGKDGLLRLGGRIGRANLPYDNLHPPLLPGHHPFARKIIEAMHQRLLHVGTDFVLTHIRHHLWITGGREAVKKVKRFCPHCIRQRAQPAVQQMADLPDCRLAAGSAPFSRTACDYFGPIETTQTRNRVTKRWCALFTCLVTRAIYLDLATTLSSDDFLLVFRRFIGLYGKPIKMYSDNGTNFVGAERGLREAVEQLHASEGANEFMKKESIEWHFQPPRTPHFGGAHESLVKSTKNALYAALDKEKSSLRYPTEDTFRTLLFEIAGLLNSRPLTYASSDPEDFRPLTPNDFLNRPPVADLPAGNFSDALPKEHFRYVQRMATLFWNQWRGVYLQSLADRKKWTKVVRNMEVGDIVMEINKDLPRGQWATGRVYKVYPGDDGLVRAVDVEFDNGIFNRGIQRLCLLQPYSTVEPSEQPVSGENVAAKIP